MIPMSPIARNRVAMVKAPSESIQIPPASMIKDRTMPMESVNGYSSYASDGRVFQKGFAGFEATVT
jgi:hypothetical protein